MNVNVNLMVENVTKIKTGTTYKYGCDGKNLKLTLVRKRLHLES